MLAIHMEYILHIIYVASHVTNWCMECTSVHTLSLVHQDFVKMNLLVKMFFK